MQRFGIAINTSLHFFVPYGTRDSVTGIVTKLRNVDLWPGLLLSETATAALEPKQPSV